MRLVLTLAATLCLTFSFVGNAQGLKTFDNDLFTFDYPDNYTIRDMSSEKGETAVGAVDDKSTYNFVAVGFIRGFQNRLSENPTNACEGVDADLMKSFSNLRDKATNEYTTVTAGRITSGLRGGRAMTVRVTESQNGQTGSLNYYFNDILTMNGLYEIAYAVPGHTPLQEVNDGFVMTIEMKDRPLGPNAACGAYVPAHGSLVRPDSDGWVTEFGPDFSMKHPQGWTLYNKGTNTDGGSDIILTGANPMKNNISIFYLRGTINKANTFSQCKTMDDVLTQYYNIIYNKVNTSRNQYPIHQRHARFLHARTHRRRIYDS